jgi:Protein of unknown function (DUF402)
MSIHWNPGAMIVMRGIWHGKIWWAMPSIIVRDEPDLIALYWQAGTPNKKTSRRVTPHDLLTDQPPPLVDGHWVKTDVLMLIPPAASHAVYAMWEAGHTRFLCWYINLQYSLQRTPTGFDGTDYMLDIVISPDRSTWRWKDEVEFKEAVSIGVYSKELARAIRAEGEAVIRQMQAGLPPFCDGWENWSPPVDWKIPDFPPGWDR